MGRHRSPRDRRRARHPPTRRPAPDRRRARSSRPGHLYISENVVRSTLAVTLRQLYLCAPTAIQFDINDGTLRAVHMEVTASYGTDLRRLAERIRATTADTIIELLGAAATNRGPIDITITDVVTGDPIHT